MEGDNTPPLSSRRPQGEFITHPPNPEEANSFNSTRKSSTNLEYQYNEICVTHKRLHSEGKINCSVVFSTSPHESCSLPVAPSSPPIKQTLEGSVHWGAIGNFSGVATPDDSVIDETDFPQLNKNLSIALQPPANIAPELAQSIASILKSLPPSPEEDNSVSVSIIQSVPRAPILSETDPTILDRSVQKMSLNNRMQSVTGDTLSDIFTAKARILKAARRTLLRELA